MKKSAVYSRKRLFTKLGYICLLAVFVLGIFDTVAPYQALADEKSYDIKWTAANPKSYEKRLPPFTPLPTSSASDPIPHAIYGDPQDSVTSLMPQDMALGQIVPFEVRISVTGSTASEGGVISFTGGWSTKTTSGDDFGYEPDYMVYAAFVDTADAATNDPEGNAKVESITYTLAEQGKKDEEIKGTIQVSGLDNGDTVIVEVWVVLKDSLPAKAKGGNVHSRLISAQTNNGDTINVGNQNVPLSKVGQFEEQKADVGITKTDSPDPVLPGGNITYTITATNYSATTVANGVVITDTLDPNVTFVSASDGGVYSSETHTVTWPTTYISPDNSIQREVTVQVNTNAPTENFTGTEQPDNRGGNTKPDDGTFDILNAVAVETIISADTDPSNNIYYEPTNVVTPVSSVSIAVSKAWVGPAGIATFHLYADGTEVDSVGLDGDTTSHTFVGLPKYDGTDGHEIEYTVTEDAIDNYATEVTGDATGGYTFTNTNTEKVSVAVSKVWVGPAGTATFHLYADDVDTGKTLVLSGETTSGSFQNLPKYNSTSGELIGYTVTEDTIDNYATEVTGDTATGYTFTNTYVSQPPDPQPELSIKKTTITEEVLVGNDAVFEIEVENTGEVPVSGVEINDSFNTAYLKLLSVKEWLSGSQSWGDPIVDDNGKPPTYWGVGNLEINASKKYQATFEALKATPEGEFTYNKARALGKYNEADVQTDEVQAGVKIRESTEPPQDPTGKLTIVKVIEGVNGNNGPRNGSPVFKVIVTGPNGYENPIEDIVPGVPVVLEDLELGDYTIEETNIPGGYELVDIEEGTVTLTEETSEATVIVTNRKRTEEEEPTTGCLQVIKEFDYGYMPTFTRNVTHPSSIKIKITGQSYPDGEEFELYAENDWQDTFCNLKPGSYTVTEVDVDSSKWDVSVSPAQVEVTAGETAEVNITNTWKNEEEPIGPKLVITKRPLKQTVNEGSVVTFTITVRNEGDEGIEGITLEDVFEDRYLKDIEVRNDENEIVELTDWHIGYLAPGESKSYAVTFRAASVSRDVTTTNIARAYWYDEQMEEDKAEVTIRDTSRPPKDDDDDRDPKPKPKPEPEPEPEPPIIEVPIEEPPVGVPVIPVEEEPVPKGDLPFTGGSELPAMLLGMGILAAGTWLRRRK